MKPDHFYEGINISFLDSLPGDSRVLDYGCGSGSVSRFLVARGFRVIAADIDPSCEQSLRADLSAEENSMLQFVVTTDQGELLPDNVGQFDAIICREVLEHVSDPNRVISRFCELLVEGGLLVLSVPTFLSERFFSFFHPDWLRNSEHVRVFRNNEIRSLLHGKTLFMIREEGQSFRWSLFWAFLIPFQVKHKMGNPVGHSRLVQAVLKLSRGICSLPGLERIGNRLLPKSVFYYAIKRKPRILLVYDYQDWVLGKWAENIRKLHGCEFDIVTISMFHAIKDKAYAAELTKKIDIVHLLLPHAYEWFRNYFSGKAVIVTMHHWVTWSENFRCAVQGANHIVTGSLEWKQRLVEKGLLPEQITVIHSGVTESFFQAQIPLLPKSPKLTCGFFAKMDSNEQDRKGTRHLLALVECISNLKVEDRFRLVITGPGWKDHIAAIQLSGVETVYLSYVAEQDMPALYRSLDVYLMLSDIEGGPVTIAEAMASGCLVFSTSVGVAKEIVQDNFTGQVIDTADPEDIVGKLLKLHADPEQRNIIIERARKLAQDHLRYEHTMLPLAKIYHDVLRYTILPGEGHLDTDIENEITKTHALKVEQIQ